MPMNIPNFLTVVRLIAAPGLAFVFLVAPRPLADWIALFLFIGAALTDYLDGWIARRWNQISAFGRMLDPIADKAMVVIALAMMLGLSGVQPLLVIPVAIILFREVFISGLREYLGNKAKEMRVTRLAKWKTMVQMVAISALFYAGIAQWNFELIYFQFDPEHAERIMMGQDADEFDLIGRYDRFAMAHVAGIGLIWAAAAMTLISGGDYFLKALPLLHERED